MGWKRQLVLYTLAQQAQQQKNQQTQQTAKGEIQESTNTGQVKQDAPVYGIGGETSNYNAGLLTLKKGKKELAKKLGTNNFAAIDEHQGQVFLG